MNFQDLESLKIECNELKKVMVEVIFLNHDDEYDKYFDLDECYDSSEWKVAYCGNNICENQNILSYHENRSNSILYFPKNEKINNDILKIGYRNYSYYNWLEKYCCYKHNVASVKYDRDQYDIKNYGHCEEIMCVLNFYDLHELERKEFMKPGGLGDSIIEEAVKRQYHPNNFEHWKHEVDLEE
jgi:hypothetical protein